MHVSFLNIIGCFSWHRPFRETEKEIQREAMRQSETETEKKRENVGEIQDMNVPHSR